MGILRLSHVEVRVPDLELATAYYTEVVGLYETAREQDRVFLKCWDEQQHHSVILTGEPTYGLNHMGWKVRYREDLDYYTDRLAKAGVDVVRYEAGELGPGHGEAIRFTLPSGHVMELVYGMQIVGNLLPLVNPPPKPINMVGFAPPRLDHIFITCEDVAGNTAFLQEVLDFHLTEQVVGDDGFQIATWLERSHHSHDIALVTGKDRGLHHFAFWVDDWTAIRDTADILAYHGVPIETNPTRHGATRGHCIYFFDPAGNRNEAFTGGYQVDPEEPPITWTEAEMERYRHGLDADGKPVPWKPGCFSPHPKDPASEAFLGGYFNDAGVNASHAAFLDQSIAPEAHALIDLAYAETADCFLDLHSCGAGPMFIVGYPYIPPQMAARQSHFDGAWRTKMRASGLPAPSWTTWSGRATMGLEEFVYHKAGALPLLFEGGSGSRYKGENIHRQIIETYLTLFETVCEIGVEEGFKA